MVMVLARPEQSSGRIALKLIAPDATGQGVIRIFLSFFTNFVYVCRKNVSDALFYYCSDRSSRAGGGAGGAHALLVGTLHFRTRSAPVSSRNIAYQRYRGLSDWSATGPDHA